MDPHLTACFNIGFLPSPGPRTRGPAGASEEEVDREEPGGMGAENSGNTTEGASNPHKPPACHITQKLQVIGPWLGKESGFETACLTADRESAPEFCPWSKKSCGETFTRKGLWGLMSL